MNIRSGQVVRVSFQSGEDGVPTPADVLPSAYAIRNSAVTSLSVTVTSVTTAIYDAVFTVPSTWAVEDSISLFATVSVNSVAGDYLFSTGLTVATPYAIAGTEMTLVSSTRDAIRDLILTGTKNPIQTDASNRAYSNLQFVSTPALATLTTGTRDLILSGDQSPLESYQNAVATLERPVIFNADGTVFYGPARKNGSLWGMFLDATDPRQAWSKVTSTYVDWTATSAVATHFSYVLTRINSSPLYYTDTVPTVTSPAGHHELLVWSYDGATLTFAGSELDGRCQFKGSEEYIRQQIAAVLSNVNTLKGDAGTFVGTTHGLTALKSHLNSITASQQFNNVNPVGWGTNAVTLSCLDSSSDPVPGTVVWITDDEGGAHKIAGKLQADSFGNAEFLLPVGTLFVWRDHATVIFTPNPEGILVS